jgi:hypothetical protein
MRLRRRLGRVPTAQQREDEVEHLAAPAELLSYVSHGSALVS